MQYYPYDSRNILYRSNLGAVAEGESLKLRLLLHRDACVCDAFLLIRNDAEKIFGEIHMQPSEWLDDYRFYVCEITPAEGLYWYRFRFTSRFGEFSVTRTDHSLGTVSSEGKDFQLTVYTGGYSTPDWLDGGIIYQIFPDRFCASGTAKAGVPGDRFLRSDMSEQPEYRQTGKPLSLGNDYYGGDLKGIEKKLPYLHELGISCIYLNPIFEAHSNHRYNTADYMKIDPLIGSEEDLTALIIAAKKYGIGIILDGVFSHTGDDSVYFNRKNRYDSVGAYNSQQSPYHDWYKFREFPDNYSCWWGVPSLPETDETNPSFSEFITGENGVLRYWLRKGIAGWRLDVADELPDEFLDRIRAAVKAEGEDKFLLGEVWEDATNKISYGVRRRFLRGKQLDSVMNYPFADAISEYVCGGNSRELMDRVLDIIENYPSCAVRLLMNHIGTHDTARILTRLGSGRPLPESRAEQSQFRLSCEEYRHGIKRLRLAAALQYTLPGVPSLYYGDEAGVEGCGDPFCRSAFPWGHENTELTEFYKKLGRLRRGNPAFRGSFIPVYANYGGIVYIREKDGNAVLIAVNRWCDGVSMEIPERFSSAEAVFGSRPDGTNLFVPAEDFAVLVIRT